MANEIPTVGAYCKARDFALAAHGDQTYGNKPYGSHLASVAQIMRGFGFDGNWIEAAWLHDVLEDTSVSFDDLRQEFGDVVAQTVFACTGIGPNRAARNRCIYERIRKNPQAACVKVADRIANVEASGSKSPQREMYLRERKAFQRNVACWAPDEMSDRLNAAYKQP